MRISLRHTNFAIAPPALVFTSIVSRQKWLLIYQRIPSVGIGIFGSKISSYFFLQNLATDVWVYGDVFFQLILVFFIYRHALFFLWLFVALTDGYTSVDLFPSMFYVFLVVTHGFGSFIIFILFTFHVITCGAHLSPQLNNRNHSLQEDIKEIIAVKTYPKWKKFWTLYLGRECNSI